MKRTVLHHRIDKAILASLCIALVYLFTLCGTGSGLSAATLPQTSISLSSPNVVTFGNQAVGTAGTPKTVTLTNTGGSTLAIASLVVTGTNPSDFAQTNTCGSSVAAGANCLITVTFKPSVSGARTAALSIADSATGGPHTVVLTGTGGSGAPAVSLSATSLAFGNQTVAVASAPRTVTLTNTGNAALSITSLAVTGINIGEFPQTNTCGSSVAAGANCLISVTFKPSVSGARTAAVTIADNATGSPHTVSLTGTGGSSAPVASLSTTSLAFGNQAVAVASAPRTVTLTNTGNAALSITSLAVTGVNLGEFPQTNTCGSSVAAGANCTISVSFKPSVSGARTAAVRITDNAAGSPHTVTLTGTGGSSAPSVSLSPTSLAFGNQAVAVASAPRTVTLTNTGNAALSITSLAVTGVNLGEFPQTNTCGSSVAAGANCTISVTFKPSVSGARTAAVTITNNAAGSPHTVTLTGTGGSSAPAVSLSPTSLAFGNQAVAVASAPRTVTLTNTGNAALSITSLAVTGVNLGEFPQTNTCGSSLAAGANCLISVSFKPSVSGARTAAVTITDNAAGSPHTVILTGTGGSATASVSLSTTSLAFGNQAVGTSCVPRNVTVSNTGNVAMSITSLAVTGVNLGEFPQTNTCSSSLAAGANCTISVSFKPSVSGARTAAVRITDNAPGSPHTVSLTGMGAVPTPSVSLSSTSLAFGNQAVAVASAPRTITLSNTGNGALSIASLAVTGINIGEFPQTNTCGSSLAAGANCLISVSFKPTVSGARTAAITITDNATGSPHTVSLTGTGGSSAPVASLSATSLAFGNQAVNTTSAARTATLSNTGNAALSITGLALAGTNAGDFAQTNNCGSSVAAGANCLISVTFRPTVSGARTAAVTITDNATGSPHTVSLTGTGGSSAPVASLSATSLAFGNQAVNTTSAARTATLSNTGNAALSITSLALAGTNAGDFAQTNNCGSSVAAGANCLISVTFRPTVSGARTAAVTITDSATGSPHTVSLTGTGGSSAPVASLSATSLAFGNQAVNTTSAARTATLSNTGNAALSITSLALAGTNAGDFAQTNNCGSSVAAGANCLISVTFRPTVSGARTAAVTITDSATGSPHTVSLTGTGGSSAPIVSLTPTSLPFGNLGVGTVSSPLSATLTNTGNATLTITSLLLTGAQASDFAQNTTCGSSLAAGATCSIVVSFTPSAMGTRTATINITDNAAGSPHTVSLSGAGAHTVILTWTPSTTPEVAGYNVYRGTASGGPYSTKLNASPVGGATYADVTAQAGQTYYYVATAVGANGVTESENSTPASATVPSP